MRFATVRLIARSAEGADGATARADQRHEKGPSSQSWNIVHSGLTAGARPKPCRVGQSAAMNERLDRRRALTLLGGAGLAALVGCSSNGGSTSAGASSSAGTTTGSNVSSPSASASSTSTEAIPEETEGPFPGDGSNGPNALTQDGVVRQDITKSFGAMSGTA